METASPQENDANAAGDQKTKKPDGIYYFLHARNIYRRYRFFGNYPGAILSWLNKPVG